MTSAGPVAVSLLVLALCYGRTLSALILDWVRFDISRHGFAVVLASAYFIWRDRQRLASLPVRPATIGLIVIAWGGAQALAASLGVELFLGRTSFLIALVGVLLYQLGWPVTRALAFPLFLLCFAIPLPALVYNPIVGLLQGIASNLTETILSLADVPLRWEGTAMMFGGSEKVALIDAYGCLRLALALAFGALAYGHWVRGNRWIRVLLAVAVFAVAILLSSLRIVAVAWFDEPKPAWSSWILERTGSWTVLAFVFALVAGVYEWLRRRRQNA